MLGRLRFWRLTVAAVLITVAALLAFFSRRTKEFYPPLLFLNGKVFKVEAVTFDTNHVLGLNDWWNVPLRKVLPEAVLRHLTPERGQSRVTTANPALVVWAYARNAATGKYVDCQGMLAFFTDDRGDVYPSTGRSHASFGGGFNRQALIFEVFPRRQQSLSLHLSPWQAKEGLTVTIRNPAPTPSEAVWTPESYPTVHEVKGVQITLASLAIQTNGGPEVYWEPVSRHWKPVLKLTQEDQPALGWETPEWEAEDPTGNRGQTLGLHESTMRFTVTAWPRPEAVKSSASARWEFPFVDLPNTAKGVEWQTHRSLGDASVYLFGLFPPGTYTFSQGLLTNPPTGTVTSVGGWVGTSKQIKPGQWLHWHHYGNPTNYLVFLRFQPANPAQRVAVALRNEQGQIVWAQSQDSKDNILPFGFNLPSGTKKVALEIVLLEAIKTRFVVKPPLPR